MTVQHAVIIDALYDYLTANSAFNTSLGGGDSTAGRLSFGPAERGTAKPYCTASLISGVEERSFSEDGYRLRVQFTLVGSRASGAKALTTVMDNLRARLDRNRISASGYDELGSAEDTIRGPILENDAWVMHADYWISGYDTTAA